MIDRKTELVALIAAQLFDQRHQHLSAPEGVVGKALEILDVADRWVRESEGEAERDFEPLIAAAVSCVELNAEGTFALAIDEDWGRLSELRDALIALNEIPDPQSVESKA